MQKTPFNRDQAESLVSRNIIKPSTLKGWERKGEMPACYFRTSEAAELRDKFMALKISQKAFVEAFNQEYNCNLTVQSLRAYLCGRTKPRGFYKVRLVEFILKQQENDKTKI